MNMPVQLNNFQKILVSKVVSSVRSHTRRNLESLQANCFHKLWPNYMSKCMAPQAAIFERDSHCIVGHIQSAVTADFEKEDGKLTYIREKYMIFIVTQLCSIILETACRPYNMI